MTLFDEVGVPLPVRTVREFTNGLASWFVSKNWLQRIGISGEVSGLHEFGNGHLGFTLKEEQAVLECIAWSDRRRDLPEFKNGVAVVAIGSVRIRPDRSGYQLLVDSVELTGFGELFLKYERLKEKFKSEGLFEQARKRSVPELPRRIALISARGKAHQDFVETLERSVPFVEVLFIETRVQGVGAEIDIAVAIDSASNRNVDAIVLTRGGGSYEDLFPFNLESVIRAIVRAKSPVLTAIGHSGDHHLADGVADRSFGTPSLVAEFIAKGWLLAGRRLQTAQRDLERAVREAVLRGEQRLETGRSELERAGLRIAGAKRASLATRVTRLERLNPQRTLADFRTRLAQGSGRLDTAATRLVSNRQRVWGATRERLDRAVTAVQTNAASRLARRQAALDRCDPLAPLARGYAIVTTNGAFVRNAAALHPGDPIEARLERGMLAARVESVSHDD